MIIDDEEDILNLFHDYLEQHGYSVSAFDNALLALDEIKRKPLEFSVIITDIRMPGMSGLELIKTINKINKDIKVIMMSAFELDDNNLNEITYHEYIQKPMRIPTLLQTVNNLLI